MEKQKDIIGRTTDIVLISEARMSVPAKVDTGADGSSIWASEINMDDTGVLSFCFFAKESPLYTGVRHRTKRYSAMVVRSAHGTVQVRYRVAISVVIGGRRVRGTFTLADRSRNEFPVLVGRRLLNRKFVVDVSRTAYAEKDKPIGRALNAELRKDPAGFFKKYHFENERGDLPS